MFLRSKYCLENVENSISKHLNFNIFWGGMPPTFPVGTPTSKLIDSTEYNTFLYHDYCKNINTCHRLFRKNSTKFVFVLQMLPVSLSHLTFQKIRYHLLPSYANVLCRCFKWRSLNLKSILPLSAWYPNPSKIQACF